MESFCCDAVHSDIQSDEEVWYFFCEPYYKYAESKRVHRRTKEGYWKKTGDGSKIKRRYSTEVIGTKKILTFHRYDAAAKKAKTEWVIHEIAVEYDPDYKVSASVLELHMYGKYSVYFREKIIDNLFILL